LLRHLGEVEIKHLAVLAVEHHESNRVAPDLIDHVTQSHEISGSFRHAHGLAVAEQLYELAQQYGQFRLAARHCPGDRLQPFDVAAVIGPEHVDHLLEAALVLVAKVGHIGCEIGVGSVGFDQRTVLVVTNLCRFEECLLPVFPILRKLSLRRRKFSFEDMPLESQIVDGFANGLATMLVQRSLRKEHVKTDVESCKIIADHRHHRLNDPFLDNRHPLRFLHRQQLRAKLLCQSFANGHQVIARIKSFGYRPNVFSQRLSVSQEGGSGQNINLRSGIVGVIFAGYVITDK